MTTLLGNVLGTTDLNQTLRAHGHSLDWNVSEEREGENVQFLSRIWIRIDVPGETQSPAGLREQQGSYCEILVEAGILVIALSIDPESTAAYLESHPDFGAIDRLRVSNDVDPESDTDTETEEADSEDTTEENHEGDGNVAPPPPATAVALSIFARLGPDFGILPDVALSVSGGARLYIDALRIEAGVRGVIPQVVDRGGVGAEIGYVLGSVSGAALFGQEFQIGFLGLLEAGVLLGTSRGVTPSESGNGPFAALGVGILGRFHPVHAFALELQADLSIPWVRTRFRLENTGDLFEPPQVVGKLGVAIEFVF